MSKITAKHIKTALLCYFRYKRQHIAATEVAIGLSYSDVLSADDCEIYEVEVKISKSDLKKESTDLRKRRKHARIVSGAYGTPHRFYFAVPIELLEETRKFVESLNPKFGIIIYDHNKRNLYKKVRVVKRAKLLESTYPDRYKVLKDYIIKRACSELCVFHKKEIKRMEAEEEKQNVDISI